MNLQIKGFYNDALVIGPNSTAMITNCLFTESYDGTIWLYGPNSYLRVRSSEFVDNYASSYGAVVNVGNGQSEHNVLEISDSEFARNVASLGGAVHLWPDNHAQISNCSLYDNTAWYDGGAIWFGGGSFKRASLTIISSEFTNNTAYYGSCGALDAGDLTSLHLERTKFVENEAYGDAGAIALASGSTAWITSSAFHRNVAARGVGGALTASGARLDIIASNFTENRAMADGGAVHAEDGCGLDLRGEVRFDGNTALLGRGGATSLEASSMQTDEGAVIFSANAARLGGAISADEESTLRLYAGCQTTTFEMHWADSPQSSLNEWAVVRVGGATSVEASSTTDDRGEWMFLEPTAQADTSISFCLSPGQYEIMGAEGGACFAGWEGGYVRAVDRAGTELATLTLEAGDGCATKVNLSIAVDLTLTDSTESVLFERNIATGTGTGFCGTGCGGAVYVGTVRARALKAVIRSNELFSFGRRRPLTLIVLRSITMRQLTAAHCS